MSQNQNGILRGRRPQLDDTIERLNGLLQGMSTAIPEVIADGIRQTLAAVLPVAVKAAVEAALAEVAARSAQNAIPVPTPPAKEPPPAPPTPPKVGAWTRVKAQLAQLRHWSMRRVAPVVARAAMGWAIVRMVGGSTIKSRTAALTTALTGTVAGLAGYALGPVGAAVLLALSAGAITAATVWAGPSVRMLVAFRHD